MTSLQQKVRDCVRTHYEEKTNAEFDITDLLDAILVMLLFAEVYYKSMEDKIEELNSSAMARGLFYVQASIARKMMKDVTGMKDNEEKLKQI